jgi:hypothetical protein
VFVVQLAQATNTLHRVLVADMATNRVGGVGRVDHHPTVADDFHSLFDQARLRVFRMNLEELAHAKALVKLQ